MRKDNFRKRYFVDNQQKNMYHTKVFRSHGSLISPCDANIFWLVFSLWFLIYVLLNFVRLTIVKIRVELSCWQLRLGDKYLFFLSINSSF